MKMLKTKHFRRLAVFLAMIAPAVYLFGVSFAGLQGAHGNTPFDSDTEIVVDSRKVVYSQLVQRDDVESGYYGVTISNFYGNYSIYGDATAPSFYSLGSSNVIANHVYALCVYSQGTAQTGNSSWQFYLNTSFAGDFYLISTYQILTPSVDGSVTYRVAAYTGASIDATFTINLFDLSVMYPDNPVLSSVSDDYDIRTAQPFAVEKVDYFPVYAVPDGSQYWFSQFFARDNFLVQWGENAISDNPYGFAPFGAFWRYLDTNVLHLSNDQVGLMGYGYIYYACHVLLFDIGFILVTFFLDFIQKIADKFTGGE